MALPETEVHILCQQVKMEFGERHAKTRDFLKRRFEQIRPCLATEENLSEERQLLLGAYFSHEYSLEAAALFNPSIVPHPEQSGLPPGALRFILSLRATGEGHISSITFRTGLLDAQSNITINAPTRYCLEPEQVPNASYENIYVMFSRPPALLACDATGPEAGISLGVYSVGQLRFAPRDRRRPARAQPRRRADA